MSKKSKTALTFIISVVLIVSLNLNTFASSSVTFSVSKSLGFILVSNADNDARFFNIRNGVLTGDAANCFQLTTGDYNSSLGSSYTTLVLLSSINNYVALPITNMNIQLNPGNFNLYSGGTYDFIFKFFRIAATTSYVDYKLTLNIYSYSSDIDKIEVPLSIGISDLSNSVIDCSTTITLPTVNYSAYYTISLEFDDLAYSDTDTVALRYVFSDVTFKMYNAIDDAFSNVIYPATSEQIDNLNDEYSAVMDELPTVTNDDVESVLDYDFSEFNTGLTFVRDLFERTMNTFNFNLVLAFALCIGFTTYVLGRRVG